MDTHIREAGAEHIFHLGLNIAGQRPSAGSGLQIHLKRFDSGALNRGLCLCGRPAN
jgi:hypothetical protein